LFVQTKFDDETAERGRKSQWFGFGARCELGHFLKPKAGAET